MAFGLAERCEDLCDGLQCDPALNDPGGIGLTGALGPVPGHGSSLAAPLGFDFVPRDRGGPVDPAVEAVEGVVALKGPFRGGLDGVVDR